MRRRYLIGLGVAAVVLAGGAVALFARAPVHRAPAGGEVLQIALVAPVEPVPEPGPVMAVGQIVDGYEHVAPADPGPPEAVLDAWLPDEVDDRPPPEEPPRYVRMEERPVSTVTVWTSEPPPPERTRDRPSFGFDRPVPDYAAEREARRRRLDSRPPVAASGLDPAARRDPEMFY